MRSLLSISVVFVGFVISVVTIGDVQAQRRSGGNANWDLPSVGSTIPNVDLFDEQGKPFSTASLRGHYSVLVFGCLT